MLWTFLSSQLNGKIGFFQFPDLFNIFDIKGGKMYKENVSFKEPNM